MFSTMLIMIHKETSFNVKPTKILSVFGGRGPPAWSTLTHGCKHSFIQLVTPFRLFTWAGFFEEHLHAFPKAVFPHFPQWSWSLPVVPSSGTRLEIKTHVRDMSFDLQSDARWKHERRQWRVFRSVSNLIQMTQTQQSDWKLGSWIINECEKRFSEMQLSDNLEVLVKLYPDTTHCASHIGHSMKCISSSNS